MAQVPQKAVWQLLKMLNMELSCDLVISLLDTYPRGMKTHVNAKTCTSTLMAALSNISQKVETSKCPSTDERINKM